MKDEYARHPDILKEHNYENFTIVGHGTKGHHFLLARHNRAHKDPLKSILKKEEDLTGEYIANRNIYRNTNSTKSNYHTICKIQYSIQLNICVGRSVIKSLYCITPIPYQYTY